MRCFVSVSVPVTETKKNRLPQAIAEQKLAEDGHLESGEGGIRTPGRCYTTPVFKTGAFGHSATSPGPLRPIGLYALEPGFPRLFEPPRPCWPTRSGSSRTGVPVAPNCTPCRSAALVSGKWDGKHRGEETVGDEIIGSKWETLSNADRVSSRWHERLSDCIVLAMSPTPADTCPPCSNVA